MLNLAERGIKKLITAQRKALRQRQAG
jgi:hypothetical protein